MELEQERQETKKQPITENCMQSVKNIAVTRKASEVKKAIHEVKEEYAKIENLVQDNEEEKELLESKIKLQDCEQHRYWEWEDMQAELFKI